MVLRYHEQLEFDFDVHGWDLLDVWRGVMPLRKVWIRLRNLPRSSAFRQALDPDATRWTETDFLLARLIDTVHMVAGSEYRVPKPGSDEERKQIAAAHTKATIREKQLARRLARRELEAKAKGDG